MSKKLTTKQKTVGLLSMISLVAAIFAPQFVGVVEVVKETVDRTDCAGLCQQEESRW